MSDYETRTRRYEFPRDPKNGMLVGPRGHHYDSEAEAMYFDQLGLCGCGCPENVHKFLISCLEAKNDEYPTLLSAEKIAEIISNNPGVVAEFVLHYLDSVELVEHGGSVYGCWRTERGDQIVEVGPIRDQ